MRCHGLLSSSNHSHFYIINTSIFIKYICCLENLPLDYEEILTPAGFEPAPPKRTDLKSAALDHSAKVSLLLPVKDNKK